MADHDGLYHLLFSHPEMVAQLLQGFVDEPWVDRLDLARMERINAKFHVRSLERRDGDVIWRIPTGDGAELYLYLLLEFQSEPQRFMAVRVLVYVGLLYQHLIAEGRLAPGGKLPPVFPIVLYNGEPRWRAGLAVEELIALPPDSPLWPWQPRLRYHLVDEGSYSGEALDGRESLATILFQLESCIGPEQAVPLVDRLADWFRRHPEHGTLRALFADFIRRSFLPESAADRDLALPPDLMEIRSMLAERVKQWQREWQRQGLEQGRDEGIRMGRQAGEAAMLRRLLEHRFGPLPAAAVERIEGADPETLEQWSLRVLTADSLGDVLR